MRLRELSDPTAAEVAQLGAELHLGPELCQALSGSRPRTRLLVVDQGVVLVVRTRPPDAGRGDVTAVVTATGAAVIGRGSPDVLSAVRARVAAGPQRPADVLLCLVDVVVDGVDEVLDRLDDQVEDIERDLFGRERQNRTQAIHAVKRELLDVRRSVVPLVAAVTRLSREWPTRFAADDGPRLDLLLARASHAAEGVEHLEALTSSVLSAQLAEIGVSQAQDQRRISAWAAIALVPTGVGAVYGMNFEHMPELQWELGYPLALLSIVALCAFLHTGFRRNGWL